MASSITISEDVFDKIIDKSATSTNTKVQTKPSGMNIRKEITKFKMKLDSKKQINKNNNTNHLNNNQNTINNNINQNQNLFPYVNPDATFESRMLSLTSDNNKFTQDDKYIKNKIIILDSNYNNNYVDNNLNDTNGMNNVNSKLNSTKDNLQPSSMKSTKNGFLYKTHTIRNKFSNPQIIVKRDKAVMNQSNSNDENFYR
jgi:hypothetical protein